MSSINSISVIIGYIGGSLNRGPPNLLPMPSIINDDSSNSSIDSLSRSSGRRSGIRSRKRQGLERRARSVIVVVVAVVVVRWVIVLLVVMVTVSVATVAVVTTAISALLTAVSSVLVLFIK